MRNSENTNTKINPKTFALIKLLGSMLIFGTVGVVVRGVAFPSGFIAMVRGFIGALIMLSFIFISGKRPDLCAIKKNLVYLLSSGAFIGINWILLFESYRYTTVATATLCYYMAPVFVVVASPFVLKARVGFSKWICVAAALVGMLLVSEPWSSAAEDDGGYIGIILALGAALFYAAVTLFNKKIQGVSSYDTTLVQLFIAAVVIIPYTLLTENVSGEMFDASSLMLLLLLGVLHTGVVYAMFFGSIKELRADTVAVFSYIDPIVAVLLSALLLKEGMTDCGIVGAVMIIASTLASELIPEKSNNKKMRL